MTMIGKVLRTQHREKQSVREIVNATSLSRNTVRKYLRQRNAAEPKYQRRATPIKLAPFVAAIRLDLIADARRPKKERRTAKALRAARSQAQRNGSGAVLEYDRTWIDK